MILLIDNYDSFVYNLARYVAELGYSAQVIRNDALVLDEVSALNPSHIIISPGPCTPNEAGISLDVIRNFMDKIPILGVCLGHQAIGTAMGGNVVRAQTPKHGKSDPIFHDGSTLFKGLPNPLTVGRYHSLIVDKESCPQSLNITAQTAQGELMAFEHRDYPLYGVQFHPESVLTDYGHQLLKNFMLI